ncbi:non-ribosomal peptide synthetase [Micromonospora sp. AKA38]|uniref:non-ribosomal peptide synthetase n=1 Tax=Micromonospora sp. AKA38 TaxID=2733861 RepID=UPI0022CC3A0F|nr:non-ribosomal peptide synthetase [Micromonospora sp. AKA38]GHJ15511.1 hypothetical protein TPA0908_35060 [Micromonospora sp. AKA38]
MTTENIDQVPSVSDLRSELLLRRLGGGRTGRRSGLPRADRDRPLRLSSGQQQMWFLNRLDPDSREFLVPLAFRIRGVADRDAIERALSALIARHEILRTRYVLTGDEPEQVIDAPAPIHVATDVLTGSTDERAARCAQVLAHEAARPFDLERDWPIRARLVALEPDDHVLAVIFHHVAFDAWSAQVFVREFAQLYRAFVENAVPDLPDLPVQYADFAAAQHAAAAERETARHLDYWREQLAELPTIDLPADRQRPAVREHDGAAVEFALPAALAGQVRQLAERLGTTPFVVFLAAFQLLVSRYTGLNDVPVGTVVSGRSRPELQGLIGYGINNLVMRTRWHERQSFAELVAAAREVLADAYDHQNVSFARLVDELQPERDMSRSPLYQVALTMHEPRRDAVALPGARMWPYPLTGGIAKCDLELQVGDAGDGSLGGHLVYATALFDESTVERMATHLRNLLAAAVADVDAPLASLELLDAAERAVVIGEPQSAAPVDRCLHELFEERVRRSPDAVAVVVGGVSLSYGELNARANRVAHWLRGRGVGAESLVGVCLTRGVHLLPVLLGVLKAGAGYVPLDPAVPVERLGFVVGDAGVGALVCERETVGVVDFAGVVLVVDEPGVLDGLPVGDVGSVVSPDGVVYVIYTSGSTGRPKGVVLSHANVVRLLSSAQEHFAFDASDVFSLFHSFAFDVSVFEMWGALAHGASVVVVGQEVTRSPEDFLDVLVGAGVTVLSQTPSAFRSLVSAAAEGDVRVGALGVRVVVFAGERLEVAELGPWVRVHPLARVALVNMYGITETTVHTTYHRLVDADLTPGPHNPIGYPLGDLRIYLLDTLGRPVPVGVTGEICVAGPGVARGYLGRPDLTAQRFVPDPFGSGGRLYRSGDLARRRADGSLDFVGRADDQVKVRGYRIELGEITVVLSGCAGVRDAVVLLRGSGVEARLVAYVVPVAGARLDVASLRRALAVSLPEYMVPAAFVVLDRLPLTANGKLDKRALPEPDGRAFGQTGYVPPENVVQERLCVVWADVLGVDRVGIRDSFFELGGDSIRAVSLVGALRAEGFDLSVRDVFDRRTVAELADLLGERSALVADDHALVEPFALISDDDRALVPDGVVDAYPLSQIQTGMVIEMLADDQQNNYHNSSAFRIMDERPFDFAAFERAAAWLVARHDMLRTSVHLTGYSVPMQLVHRTAEVPIGWTDHGTLDAAGTQHVLQEFATSERARPFDLTRPTLMRFFVHVTEPDSWWISITECHPVMEGWSYHTMLMELVRAYQRIAAGQEPDAEPMPAVRFADAIAGELTALDSPETRAYWRDVVGRYEKFTLPRDWGDRSVAERTAYHTRIPWTDLEPGLRRLAAQAGASMKAVMVSAFGKVLSRLSEEPAVHAGLVYDTRPEVLGADRVFGMYLNTLPFPFDPIRGTWRDLVTRTFRREVESWSHRRYPLPAVQRDNPGRQGLIEVFFNYQDFRQIDTELVDATQGLDDSPTEFPLTVSSRAGHIFLTSDVRSLTPANTDRIAGLFRTVLAAMAADPEGDATIALATPDELRDQQDWAVGAPLPGDYQPVLELFEQQAARTPDAAAVVTGGHTLTYAELDDRAERYAAAITARGAGPESVVAVLLDRGPELAAALLGAWKAGAAYLPLDAAFPAERVAGMVADAHAAVVITERDLLPGVADVPADRRLLAEDLPADRPAVTGRTRPAADQLAYVIYTSGSTGRPKGVAVSHRGLANHVSWAARTLASRGTGGAPLFSSVAFDLVVPNLWGPLVTGQPVTMVPNEVDLGELGAHLDRHGPYSFIKLTPGHLEVLTTQLAADQAARLAPVLVVAGEALTRHVVRAWQAKAPAVELINEYGPTEASVGTCVHPVDGPVPDVVPIGSPLPGMVMRVLDRDLRPLPTGVTGELYVGGTGVARGYLGRPDLTADRFLPDPYGPPGARLYRTGDLVRLLPDGAVDFRGRRDGQLKIRGYRVELGEIEATLGGLDEITDCRVVARETGPDGERQLVAYLVADGEMNRASIRERLTRALPDYLVPSAFVQLERLPLNANGKLDRHALPAPEETAPGSGGFETATPLQERLVAVWSEVLGREAGVRDDFFDLGGDSIRAVALIGALRAEGWDVSVREILQHRTVDAVSRLLTGRDALDAGDRAAVAPFELVPAVDRERLPDGLADAYPLSMNQSGMLIELLAGNDDRRSYHNVNVYEVRDDRGFDPDAFERAVREVVRRHDVLRTSVRLTGYSEPMQLVHRVAAAPCAWRDLRHLDSREQFADMSAFVAAERADLFDLSSDEPLLRVHAHVTSDTEWLCGFTQNHALLDGWSNQLFLMDVLECYRRLRDGTAPDRWDAPSVRFADTVAAERRALESERTRAYWRDMVRDHVKLTMPAGWSGDRDAPAEVVRAGMSYADLEEGLRRLAASARTSVKSVLVAAHAKVMSQLTTAPAFHTGLVTHTRLAEPGGDRVYGNFLNTLPFPVRPDARTWRDLVRQVSDTEIEIWDHRHFPMPAIERPAGTGRLVDVFFCYLDFHRMDTEAADDSQAFSDAPNEFAVGIVTLGGRLSLRSNSHVLSHERARQIVGMFRDVLAAMAADPGGDARATFGPEPKPRTALRKVRRPGRGRRRQTPHEVFADRAARTPSAVAVIDGGTELTYRELDERANRLAHRLRTAGAGPETVTGICLPPGADAICAVLGVLKTGGAYLPLAPGGDLAPARELGLTAIVTGDSSLHPVTVAPDGPGDAAAPEVTVDPETAMLVGPAEPYAVVSHADVLSEVTAAHQAAEFDEFDAWTLDAGWADDPLPIWGALLYGGRLVVLPPDETPARLLDRLRRHEVSVLSSRADDLRDLAAPIARDEDLAVRLVLLTGDAGHPDDLRPLVAADGDGPAVVSRYRRACWRQLEPADLDDARFPIGDPLPGRELRVLDAQGRPVPDGVPGDLHLGGIVPRGFTGRPALTADRFRPDAFGPAGSRLFATGDRAAVRADGALVPQPSSADDGEEGESEYEPPRSPLQSRIAAIWQEVLGRTPIGVNDMFFDVGGDSMRALAAVGVLREEGLDVSVRDLFRHPTVAELADRLAGRDRHPGDDEPVAPFALIGDDDRTKLPPTAVDAYPLSQVQAGMVVEMLEDPTAYRSVVAYEVIGSEFDEAALRAALVEVTGRHDALRTSLHLTGYSVPTQVVHVPADVPVTVHDLRDVPADRRDEEFRKRLAADQDAPYDVARTPLLRVVVARLEDTRWWLGLGLPHALSEGWGLAMVQAELHAAYRALAAGDTPPPYEAPPVRYADFIAAELRSLAGDEDAAYWRSVVDDREGIGVPAVWAGPDDVPYQHLVPLDDLEPRLRELAAGLRVPVKSVLLAAHVAVMGRLTETRRGHVGLVTDARPELAGASRVYGMHLNTVPFAVDRTAARWRDLIRGVFAQETALWPHRRYPMPAIQRDSSAGRQVLTAFNYVDLAGVGPRRQDADGDIGATLSQSHTEFDLTVHCRPDRINLTTRTGVMSRENGALLAKMYRTVLERMAQDADGDARASVLSHAGPGPDAAEREPFTFDPVRGLATWAAETPDAPALAGDVGTVSWGQLGADVDRLAGRLRAAGVGPGVVAAVCLPAVVERVTAVLAVLRAGGVCLPLDPETPVTRLAFQLADARARVVVADRESALDTDLPVLVTGDGATAAPEGEPAPEPEPSDPAFLLYTSGSTGRPKGVSITRRGAGNHLLAKVADLGMTAADTLAQNAPPTFVVSIWQMLAGTATGCCVRVVPEAVARDPHALFALVADGEVTVLEVVPTLLRAALDGGVTLPPGAALRRLVVTGEAFPAELAARWLARFPQVGLLNSYGQTECADDVAHHALTTADGLTRVPIGRPVRGTRLYVLDEWGAPVIDGVPGELHAGGLGVGDGYLNQPALTAERFVPDPWGPAGGRLYRTGDLARRLPDGTLDYLGRSDQQVKVRGHRIEPGEIEAALTRHPLVRQAVVVHRDDRLIGYVAAADERPTPADLRAALEAELAAYLIPAAFVVLDAIPLSPNGKVDRGALPEPGAEALAVTEFVAPADGLQAEVAGLWARALGVGRVGLRDGFFALGGDSLRAVALVGDLRAAGYETTVRDVLDARTVERLCERLRPVGAGAGRRYVEAYAQIERADRDLLPPDVVDAYPLGRTQLGMVIEAMSGDGRGAYHMVNVFRVTDGHPLDEGALRRAVAVVADRHETLRTSIRLTGFSAPMQLVHRTVDVPVEVHDLRDVDPAEHPAIRERLVARQRAEAFDFAVAPLVRVLAHQESDEAWWLTLTQTHALTEGWSTHQVLMELLDCYDRLRRGAEPEPYDRPGVRFADAIAAERAALASDEDRAYWERITGDNAGVTLPRGWAGDSDRRVFRQIPYDDLLDGLNALAAETGTSLKTVLLSAYLKVMGQLTDEPAYHAGMVVDTRPEEPGADRVPGMYVNTLPITADRTAATWHDFVTRVFARELDVWQHRRYPMPAIRRDGGGDPLIQVFFNHLDFRGVDTGRVAAGTRTTNSPNEFALSLISQHGRFHLGSSERHLDSASADRLAGMLRAVLESMAAGGDGDARATYLPAGERELLLRQASPSHVTPVDRCLHELFEERVRRSPDAVAVVVGGVSLSYGELNARANRVAHWLRGRGVGAESLVGVCLTRGVHLLPVLLGVLKAGAGYVPLDPAVPVERLGFVVGDAGVGALVCERETVGVVDFAGVVLVVDEPGVLDGLPVGDVGSVVSPDGVVYVIYTSGSTGRPKGVVLSHANVVRLLSSAQEHFAFDASDVFSLFHSFAFDVSVFEMWGALAHGASVVVVGQEVTRSPEDFLDVLVGAGVTVLSQTPSAFRSLVSAAAEGDVRVGALGVRVVVFAGERLEVAELGPWVRVHPLARVALVNMYGITETTVHTTYHRLTGDDLESGAGNPIGRPLSDLRVHLLDAYGELVPVGVTGEICVAGPGVARGYLGRPDLTAQRFVPDPFGSGGRLYRSGDLARRRADGSLDFVGRADDQVKVRGYRIELGEITVVLSGCAGVRDAVVLLRGGGVEARLVAYVVPVAGARLDVASLRRALAVSLPEYMVPAAFVVLDRLPLTANGKLDKRALPEPDGRAFGQTGYVPPENVVQERLCVVWADVLGVDRVGIRDSFFELGGDSIRAVAVAGRLREDGLAVTARDVLSGRTVTALAERLTAGGHATESGVEPFALIGDEDRTRLPADAADAYPLSQNQLGMLVEMTASAGPLNYHRVATARIPATEPFSADALQRTVDELVARHDVLRTSVDLTGYTVPLQVVHAAAALPVRVADLRGESADGCERALRDALDEESRTPLPHECAPLLRIRVHLLPGGEWTLFITQSHLIVDGWTFSRLRADLLDTYRAIRAGQEPPERPRPAVRFADTIAAEVRALASPEDREYWRHLVTGRGPLVLPAGLGGSGTGSHRFDLEFGDLAGPLRELASRAGAPIKSVLLAAHLAVLRQLSPERRFHTGLVVHCRPEAAGAELVYGSHLNTVPFPVDPAAADWADEVRRAFDRELEMWPHRNFPMPAMQVELTDGGRLLHTFFSYEEFDTPAGRRPPTTDGGGFSRNEFPYAVTASDERLVLQADDAVLDREHGERVIAMYRAVLEAMAAGTRADRVHLPVGERDWLLAQGTAPAGPAGTTALHQIEEHAARTPHAPAVVTDDGRLSFAELDARADRIGQYLRSRGVTAESRVAVLLRRGPDLVATMLGVWKAGGAYVPLDPANPPQRLRDLLRTADPEVIVSEAALAGIIAADPDLASRGVLLDSDAAAFDGAPAGRPPRMDDPDLTAYVIFTSGSTGVPKGVQISHGALANYLRWARPQYLGGGRRAGSALFCSISFDVSVTSLFITLSDGLPVHLAPQDLDLGRLGEWLLRHGPFDLVDLTPSLFDLLAGQLTDEQFEAVTDRLSLGGEAFRGAAAARLYGAFGDGRVINSYGPTEATVASTEHVLTGWRGGDTVPIGRPMLGTSAYVLDERLDPLPVGVPGELFLGGESIARGYLDRPGLTADRFVPDPFGAPGTRLYRTGDLATVLPDGTLEHLGRLDEQVKVRGNRVEPGEIESVLSDHPEVSEARVLLRGDRLTAYLVPAGEPVSGLHLREWLARRLPEYMVPSAYVSVPAIPLTHNGKLDRAALPDPDGTALAHRPYVPPRSAAERRMAELWSQVLGVDPIGRDDRFFELGGNSLVVFRLISAAAADGLALSLVQVYADDSLRAVAATAEPVRAEVGPVSAAWNDPLTTPEVPGVSVAVLRDGELVDLHAEGLLTAGRPEPVTADTMFQAGSLSKHVTAFGVLRLADRGVLDLDRPVRDYLRGDFLPPGSPITLRHLLAHRSGIAPAPAPGYPREGGLPAVTDLLRGPDFRVHGSPGDAFEKANAHYWVVEQVLTDVTGTPLADLMRELVLDPVGMAASDFGQEFPERYAGSVATGHTADGRPLDGGWLRWPDMAAGGLWTTAADLARLALEIRRAHLGRPQALLSRPAAGELLTVQHPDSAYGLGTVVDESATEFGYGHGGSADGYHAISLCRLRRGSGVVVLTNSDAGAAVAKRLVAGVDGGQSR